MKAADRNVPEPEPKSWHLSFSALEVGGSAALGADVRLDLAASTTLLVGKNGVGKSLLLEKLESGIEAALGGIVAPEPDPGRFACEAEIRASAEAESSQKLRYECRWQPREADPRDSGAALHVRAEADAKVEETCRLLNDRERLLWRVDDGVLTYNTGKKAEIVAGRTLVNWTLSRRGRGAFLVPVMAHPIQELFSGVVRVPAGIPRGDSDREELALPYPEPLKNRSSREAPRIRRLAYTLASWHEGDPQRFEELVDLGRRTGLLDEVEVKLYRDPDAGRTAHRRDLVSVLFDGTDLGLLSDGTLRVAEILMWLLWPGLKLLLIEEPETAVHPGLLAKLLAEIDAYSQDREVVLSTQSPNVVSWADPSAIRLVERRAGQTEVRCLRDDEVARLSGYLHDEGMLGDFVYSGALDG